MSFVKTEAECTGLVVCEAFSHVITISLSVSSYECKSTVIEHLFKIKCFKLILNWTKSLLANFSFILEKFQQYFASICLKSSGNFVYFQQILKSCYYHTNRLHQK